jgi:hypothetical protein
MKLHHRNARTRLSILAGCAALAMTTTVATAAAEEESGSEPPTRQEVEAKNLEEVSSSRSEQFTIPLSVPTGASGPTAEATVTCTLTFDVAASYFRGAGTLRTEVRGDMSGITRCDGDPADPVKGTIRVRVTDFGVPVFGSTVTDSDSDAGGRNVALVAAAQTDTPVYTFPSTIHGVGSLYEWEFTATVQSGNARNDVCVEATAIDPGEPSYREVPC